MFHRPIKGRRPDRAAPAPYIGLGFSSGVWVARRSIVAAYGGARAAAPYYTSPPSWEGQDVGYFTVSFLYTWVVPRRIRLLFCFGRMRPWFSSICARGGFVITLASFCSRSARAVVSHRLFPCPAVRVGRAGWDFGTSRLQRTAFQ